MGGASGEKNILYLKSWKSICVPKVHGGLGFRRMSDDTKVFWLRQVGKSCLISLPFGWTW